MKETFLLEEIQFAIRLSLKTSIISTTICLVLALPTAYALYKIDFKFKRIIKIILYLPMSLPHLISGIALILVCGNSPIGRFLQNIGLDFVFTVKGIILAQVFVNLAFTIKILLTAFEKSNYKMEFVARTLGCNSFQSFYKVALPLIKVDTISAVMMTFSRTLGEFGSVMLLVGTTRMKTELLPTAIFLNVSTGDMDIAISTATILIILSLILMLPFEVLERRSHC